MNVILINRTQRMKVFALPHDIYCEAQGRCGCGFDEQRGEAMVAPSVALLGGARSPELPAAVLRVPDVLRSMTAGELGIDRVAVSATCTRGDGGKSR